MPFDTFDFETLSKDRRKAIVESIRPVDQEEMKKIGNQLFRFADDPWREAYFTFLSENTGATFHHALTNDGVNVVYCRDKDKGIWFLPGSGMGPLQERGRKTMKEIIEGKR